MSWQVRGGNLATAEGVSYLEAKHLLLLHYCINIVFYLLLKAEGRPVRDHPVIPRLLELRAYLEKIRPIDKKLQYQMDKLLMAAQLQVPLCCMCWIVVLWSVAKKGKAKTYTFHCQLNEKPSITLVCPGLGLYIMAEILPEDVINGEIPDTTRVKTLYDNLGDVLLVRLLCRTCMG